MSVAPAIVCSVVPVEAVIRHARTYPVFPCRRYAEEVVINGRPRLLKPKSPLTKHGFQDATQDPDQIRAWWQRWPDALVGVPTGSITGLVVVDFDSHKADDAARDWIGEHTDWLLQTRSHTTLNGGRHYLYRLPPGSLYGSGVNLTLGGGARVGIDLRSEGGYIIWWPMHGGVTTGEIAPLPVGLIDERKIEKRELPPLPASSPEKWQRDRLRVAEALAWVDPSNYETWARFGMALHLHSGGCDDGFMLWHAWSAGEITGEVPSSYSGIEDCRYHWASYRQDKPREQMVTVGSLFASAKSNGWVPKGTQPPSPDTEEGPPAEFYEALAAEMASAVDPETGETIRKRTAAPQEAQEKPERRPIDWASLEKREAPVRPWRIQHWLAPGVTLLAGPGAAGKSLLSQMLGTSLALGKRFVDDVMAPCNVLYWACEDDHDELWRRQIPISRHFMTPMAALEKKFVIEPRIGRENTLYQMVFGTPQWTPLVKELRDQVLDYQADVLILDNVGQVYGAEENNRHQVTAFVNGLVGLALQRQVSIILLAHPAKAAGSEFSGSTAWENAVRMRWYLGHTLPDEKPQREDEEGATEPNVRYLAKRKANYSVKDYRKLEIVDGVFRTDSGPGEFTQRYGMAGRIEGAEMCVLHALERLNEAGIRVTDGRTSPDYLPKKMRQMHLASDYSPRDLADAVNRLRLNGRIVEGVVGKYSNREPKMGLKVAP